MARSFDNIYITLLALTFPLFELLISIAQIVYLVEYTQYVSECGNVWGIEWIASIVNIIATFFTWYFLRIFMDERLSTKLFILLIPPCCQFILSIVITILDLMMEDHCSNFWSLNAPELWFFFTFHSNAIPIISFIYCLLVYWLSRIN